MKTNAPERLYLSENIYSTYLYQVPDPDDETAVEYTRTDAFIEMACKWLKNNVEKYYYLDEAYDKVISTKNLNIAFKNYMKGK